MTAGKIAILLGAEIVCHDDLRDKEIMTACGSDMMSDVMAFYHDGGLLLTGLVNIQTVRTASLLDIDAVCFVRGKIPNTDMLALAQEAGIIIMQTALPMFPACGILYQSGVKGNIQAAYK